MSHAQPPNAALVGRRMPDVALPATGGGHVVLSDPSLGKYVLFIYPRTGRPDQPDAAAWVAIPGAKGCTAEACDFRDLTLEFAVAGYAVFGLSSQISTDQREAADRLHLPYSLLSDAGLDLAGALGLATFTFDELTLYKRVTLLVESGVIAMVIEPGADPVGHANEVLAELRAGGAAR